MDEPAAVSQSEQGEVFGSQSEWIRLYSARPSRTFHRREAGGLVCRAGVGQTRQAGLAAVGTRAVSHTGFVLVPGGHRGLFRRLAADGRLFNSDK